MRAVIQRVTSASVSIDQQIKSSIGQGVMVLLGIEERDAPSDIEWLVNKICKMRIFADEQGLMNLSLLDINGDSLVVSQFTLHAQTKKGNRPSFIKAAKPAMAIPLYEQFLSCLSQQMGKECGSGEFGADMQVQLINDGPVTITIDTQNRE
ncbi:D-aminoacyl-tRNA deacylase [Rubritalea marina]|uniref:D-aminoacyl-tRNA deacylase n=1 Tax=Rubritalea marina TaxID=361055 RepID=UPI00036FED07|nr:D-aminoacyl-tRNA deacylase [Rubritalea marina]